MTNITVVVVPRNDVFTDNNGRDERLGFLDTFLTAQVHTK